MGCARRQQILDDLLSRQQFFLLLFVEEEDSLFWQVLMEVLLEDDAFELFGGDDLLDGETDHVVIDEVDKDKQIGIGVDDGLLTVLAGSLSLFFSAAAVLPHLKYNIEIIS